MMQSGDNEEVTKNRTVHGLNNEIEVACIKTQQSLRSVDEQRPFIGDIRHSTESFPVLNQWAHNLKYKNYNAYQQNRTSNNTGGVQREKTCSQAQITTDLKGYVPKLKVIPEDIIIQYKKEKMCLKYGKGQHKWLVCNIMNLITCRTVPKRRDEP